MVRFYRACYKTDWGLDKTFVNTIQANNAGEAEDLVKFWHPCARQIEIMLMTDKQTERYMPK